MKYKVTLRGKIYEVEVEAGEAILADEYEACAPAAAPAPVVPAPVAPAAAAPAAPSAAPLAAGEVINSPLPGNILKILVKPGEQVKKGQNLLIIEAMKMENEIVAPRDATVAQIAVSLGAVVDTGTPLLVLA